MSLGQSTTSGQTQTPKHAPQRAKSWTRRLGRLSVLLLIALSVYAGVVFGLQRRLLFPRDATATPASYDPPGWLAANGVQAWTIDTPDGPVDAWYAPPPEAPPETAPEPASEVGASGGGPVVIYGHPNATVIQDHPDLFHFYRTLGAGVLLIEYRGYGRSAGSPSQKAITEDFVAGYDRLIQQPGVDPSRIIFHGRSLGGGVVGSLMRHRRPAGVILESTFTSVPDMAWRLAYIPRLLVLDRFETLDSVKAYDGPVLVMHGQTDEVIPFDMGQRLHQAAKNGRFLELPGGHNDGVDPKAYKEAISKLLEAAYNPAP